MPGEGLEVLGELCGEFYAEGAYLSRFAHNFVGLVRPTGPAFGSRYRACCLAAVFASPCCQRCQRGLLQQPD